MYPGIRLEWAIDPNELKRGITLLAFRSTSSLCPEDPDDLTKHGQMILETTANGEMEEHLPEGVYYFTFLLRRKGLFNLWDERSEPLRFQETIPSAKVAIGRLEDRLHLQDLIFNLGLQHVRQEITESDVRVKLHAAQKRLKELESNTIQKPVEGGYVEFRRQYDDALDSLTQATQYIEEIKKDPRFKSLSKTEREKFIKAIRDSNEPKERVFKV